MIMTIILVACAIVIPYFMCSINSAIIVTKIKTGKDIRTMGSGNAGLTNTLRTQGKIAALFVLLGDVAKGVLSIVFIRLIALYGMGFDVGSMTWVLYLGGVSGILGHIFPIYYHFKGGKGVLVTVSILLAIEWLPAVILLGIFALIVLISRYVSLGSIIAAILYPFTVLIFGFVYNDPCVIADFILSGVIAFLIVFMHRENIKRLRSKTEKKLGQKA